ncbi:MAG TPA: metallophosphoesterase [Candidatus Sulfopaludibacter sp.]|jgi:3',5'-cyclic AMP phosphodiesterase CpdA|nr:metallophosphoesterase [Candidatus Sulfopaludibacter sp.]
MKKSILSLLGFAAVVLAQTTPPPVVIPQPVAVPPTFIQMTDPQFGMFTGNKGFEHETANFEFAIATANRLKPAFVVVTGDLINSAGDDAQTAEYNRISAKLNPAIKLYNVAGNHDVGNEPTKETLARYRERFGPDYYTFRSGQMEGIVLNSNLEKGVQNVPDEAAKMEAWFKTQLAEAQRSGVKQIIVFQHIPFFLKTADEPDQYFNIPKETRTHYLAILHQYGVKQVFAGHLHHNSEGKDGDLEMYTTGPVGMPLDGGKSGMRLVIVKDGAVTQKYYDFGELPQ